MKTHVPDAETLLEIGLAVSGAVLLGGLGVLVFGSTAGRACHRRRHAAAPPAPGSVPAHRHQNIVANPAR
jgi:hypothetical protein